MSCIKDGRRDDMKCHLCGRIFTHANQSKWEYGQADKGGRPRWRICRARWPYDARECRG